MCVRLWILRFSERANTLPQPGKGQGKGFSPVCTRMWFTSLYLALKGFSSLLQEEKGAGVLGGWAAGARVRTHLQSCQ